MLADLESSFCSSGQRRAASKFALTLHTATVQQSSSERPRLGRMSGGHWFIPSPGWKACPFRAGLYCTRAFKSSTLQFRVHCAAAVYGGRHRSSRLESRFTSAGQKMHSRPAGPRQAEVEHGLRRMVAWRGVESLLGTGAATSNPLEIVVPIGALQVTIGHPACKQLLALHVGANVSQATERSTLGPRTGQCLNRRLACPKPGAGGSGSGRHSRHRRRYAIAPYEGSCSSGEPLLRVAHH
jgi:hypothetical protein